MSFYIKRRNKSNKGCAAYSVAAFIRVAALNRSFTVTVHLLGKKEKMKDLLCHLISQVRSCQTGNIVLSSREKLDIFALFSLGLVP